MSKESLDLLITRANDSQRVLQQTMSQSKAYDYPFSQYNLFVECYNRECNCLDDRDLQKMQESELYRFIFQIFAKPLGQVILTFSLTFLPILNIFFYVIIWKSFFLYNKAKKIFKKNMFIVSNPFQNMIYSPEVCEMMGKNHWFFSISEKDIYGFAFDAQTVASLKSRTEGGLISFMVYDDNFQNYYRQFPKHYKMHITWVILSTLMIGIFTVLAYLIIKYLNKGDSALE